LWDGTLAGSEEYAEVWDSELADGSKLYIEWGREGDPFDGLSQVPVTPDCGPGASREEEKNINYSIF
jgi:hypothetical protein